MEICKLVTANIRMIDQLKNKLEQTSGEARLDVLFEIIDYYYQQNPQAMDTYIDEVIELAIAFKDQARHAKGLLFKGAYQWLSGNLHEAQVTYRAALELCEKIEDQECQAEAHSRLGVIYENRGNFEEALKFHHQALWLRQTLNDQGGIIASHINIGSLYFKTGDYALARDAYQHALDLALKADLKEKLPQIYSNLGIAYTHLEFLEKGLELLQKSVDIVDPQVDRTQLAANYVNLGDTYYRMGRHDDALKAQHKALEIAEAIGFGNLIPYIYVNIGQVLTARDDYAGAETNLKTALSSGRTNGDKRVELESYKSLSALWEKRGDFEQALLYYKAYSELKDEVLSESKQIQITRLQALFEAEKRVQEAEIYRLRNVEMVNMNDTIEKIEREKDNFLKVVAHDLQGPLSSIQMNADMVRTYMDQLSPDKIRARLDAMMATSQAMTQTVTQILDLRLLKSGKGVFNMSTFDPAPLVSQVIEAYQARAIEKNIKINPQILTNNAVVKADEVALRRIIDNLVSNAVKYTEPDHQIFVQVNSDDDHVHIVVKDEGLGMSGEDLEIVFNEFMTLSAKPTGGERSTGLGLAIVKMLAEGMNAEIKAESDGIGKGSTFTLTLPRVKAEALSD